MEKAKCLGEESVKVFVRVRPPDSYEDTSLLAVGSDTSGVGGSDTSGVGVVNDNWCLQVATPTTVVVHSKPEPKTFTFDHVAGPEVKQEDVFSAVGRPIIDGCMNGYNGTIFAYGQTGSGKTFTMIGPSDDNQNIFTHELRGVIPRSFEYLFSLINREKLKYGDLVQFLCKCSFLEIYNEQIYDLLDPASTGLHLRENIKRGVYVDGLIEQVVSSAAEAYQVLTRGWINRRVASTSMNRESSRSHAVFMLCVESEKRETYNSVSKIRSSMLNLVDLAGSERQRDAHTVGIRLKEAGSINRSLSALGNVIMALVEVAHGKSRHVHYRDSKLTFLLRDSLGGNAKTNLIANVHPLARCFGESLSTLQFARRAKMIKNKVVVNEDTAGNVTQLQAEIKKLRDTIDQLKGGVLIAPLSEADRPEGVRENGSCELRDMLTTSMTMRDKAESEKRVLLDRVDKLQELCRRKDKSLQTTKMILKLRNSHINNLEKKKKGEMDSETFHDSIVSMLQDEVKQLKLLVEHNPEVTKFAIENLDLRAEVKQLRELSSGSNTSDKKELIRLQKYTLHLERQIKDSLNTCNNESLTQLTTLNTEVERLHHRCQHLQTELDMTQQKLFLEREEHKMKQSSLESCLSITKKSNEELEKTIEVMKVKHNIERESMNDSHLNAIRAIITPGSTRRTKSVTSTPFQKLTVTHLRQNLFFAPLSGFGSQIAQTSPDPKLSPLNIEDEVEEKNVKEEVPLSVDLHVVGEVLLEQMKGLQDSNSDLEKEMEARDHQILQLKSTESILQSQVEEKTEEVQEIQYTNKLIEESKSKLEASNIVLQEEVRDLKLCLQSADKELLEVKNELCKEKQLTEAKRNELFERIGGLEQELAAETGKYERTLENLQNLQDEVETLREEVIFKDHYLQEKEDQLKKEKQHSQSLQLDIQSLEEQLAFETDKVLSLTSQLENDESKKELAATVEQNVLLVKEIGEVRNELQEKLSEKQNKLDSFQNTIQSLTSRSSQDHTAITELMTTVNQLRGKAADDDSKLTSMKKDLEERDLELNHSITKIDMLTSQIEEMKINKTKLEIQHTKEIKVGEINQEVLSEELEEVRSRLEELSTQWNTVQLDTVTKEKHIEDLEKQLICKELEIQQLTKLQTEKEAVLQKVQSLTDDVDINTYLEDQADRIHQLESERNGYSNLLSELQNMLEEKDEDVQYLKVKMTDYETLEREHELLKTQYISQQYKMEADLEEHVKKELEVKQEVVELTDALEKSSNQSTILKQERELAIKKAMEATQSLESVTQNMRLLEEQMQRLRGQEEVLFQEKESLRSQLEGAFEEKSKLIKENQELIKENAQLSGHRNIRQRIQFHAKLKVEHHKLLEQYKDLQEKFQHQTEYIKELDAGVKPEADSRSKYRLRSHKENIFP